jgi:hypothetical protein
MKKLAVLALLVILALNQSQAKMTSVERVMVYQKRSELRNQTLTKSVLVRAVPKHKRQVLAAKLDIDDNDDPAGSDELDVYIGFRRPDLVKDQSADDDVSDYVTVRLAVARAKAMAAYRQKYCKADTETV